MSGRTWDLESWGIVEQDVTVLRAIRVVRVQIRVVQTFCDEDWPTPGEVGDVVVAALRARWP